MIKNWVSAAIREQEKVIKLQALTGFTLDTLIEGIIRGEIFIKREPPT